MHQQVYAEIFVDDPAEARRREYQAMDHVVVLLEDVRRSGDAGPKLWEALDLLDSLWTIFLNDLASDANELPEIVRARLISIGLWIFRRTSALRIAGGGDVSSLIEINEVIRDGLR